MKLVKIVFSYKFNHVYIHVNNELYLSVHSVALEIRIRG